MRSIPLSRRKFLRSLAVSGVALGLRKNCEGAALRVAPLPALEAETSFQAEGARLTQSCFDFFWDGRSRMFRAPVLSAETVASDELHDRGYTFWPSLLALHALIEGERANSGLYASHIGMVYDGLEQYYSDDLHAYTSWVHFPGNIDAYYDDNSWAVIVLVEAYMACLQSDPNRAALYLKRAKTVMADFVVKGYDTTEKPGECAGGLTPPNLIHQIGALHRRQEARWRP
jgi:hypothetical protein